VSSANPGNANLRIGAPDSKFFVYSAKLWLMQLFYTRYVNLPFDFEGPFDFKS